MAKFCVYCGKALEEGQVCDCQPVGKGPDIPVLNPTFQSNQQYEQQFQVVKEKSSAYLKQLAGVFLSVLKQPADTIKGFAGSGNIAIAFGLIVIQAILVGLFGLACAIKINNNFFDDLDMAVSLVVAFFVTALVSFCASCLLAGILLLLVKVFKGQTDIKKMLCVVSVRSIALIPLIVLSVVVVLIYWQGGYLLFSGAEILGLAFLIQGLKGATVLDDNKAPYVLFLSFLVFSIAYAIIVRLIYKVYLPSDLIDMFQYLTGTSLIH